MCLLFSLIPATFLVTIGYFALFCSSKAEGGVRRFGQILAIWIFLVALLPLTAGAYVTFAGLCPIGETARYYQEQ
jgi:hypothetical protein